MIVRCADAENRVNKKKHARCAPAPACRPTHPPPKNARLSRRRLASAYRTTKICQLIVSERTGKPIGTATTPRGGDAIYPAPAQSIPARRYRRICRCRRFVKEITRRGLARQYNLTPSHSLVEPDHGPFNR